MATTVVKNYNVAPYYDDFDESKNYHRILFKPGYSVQARELTQLQTSLQAQIDRYGQFAFKDGSRVINGKATLNVEYDFIKIESAFTHSTQGALNTDSYLDDFVGTTITGTANTTNQVTAKVLAVIASESSDPNTLYIKYDSAGGTNRTVQKFVAGEEFVSDAGSPAYGMVGGGSNIDGSNTASSITDPVGQGSAVNIEEGVYFIAGSFVYVPAGTLVLDKYTNTPNYIVGLKVTQNTISSDNDTDLVDNAQGSPNYSAPGADRYQITTTLIKQDPDLANRTEDSYITLLVIEDGKARIDKTDKNNDTELTERLARRTYEESGDYSVNPYQLNVRQHLDDGSNNGYLTAANGGDGDKLAIGVEPNVAYVKGFRVENTTTKYVELDKPRGNDATRDVNQEQLTLSVGNYIKLEDANLAGIPDINTFDTIDLHSSANGGGSVIGTARVRGFQRFGVDDNRLWIFDINMSGSNTFSSVASVVWVDGSTIKFIGNLETTTIFNGGNSSLVYALPYSATKTLYDPSNPLQVNTSYTVKQNLITNAGTATFQLGQGDFTNASAVIAAIVPTSGSWGSATAGVASVSISGDTITFTEVAGRVLSSNPLTGSEQIAFVADVAKAGLTQKQKNKTTGATVSGTLTNNELSLGKADIIKVTSIVAGSTDVTDRFTLDNGQRDNYYDVGKVILKGGQSNPGSITVTFDYYTHQAGDYFTVDSYPTADYESIPSFNGINGTIQLRDAVDFRPRKDDAGANFTSTGASVTDIPADSSLFRSDITHYLPRIDKLFVSRKGEFKIAVGVPSETPKAPEVPDDAMALYDLRLSPYVFTLDGIKPKIVDNKRYTMRDIGSLDKRIKNLEYYTSLSLLEQSAADAELFDGSGFSRLKNGFIVDGFTNHNVGDVSNPDYKVSIDRKAGILRPKFDERSVNLIRKAGDTGTAVKNGSIVSMPHTETNYINQPYASTFSNVNPYNVFSWAGTIELSPESDEWKEVDNRPAIIVDDSSQYEQFKRMAEEAGILGTVWNEWETNWMGVDVSEQTSTTGGGRRPGRFFDEDFWWQPENQFDIRTGGGGFTSTTTTTTTTTTNQSRSGIHTDLSYDTVLRSDGRRVVEVNFVPFIRSREVFFKAQLMKPNTQVYAFFDGANIADYIRGHDGTSNNPYVEFSDRTGVDTFEGDTEHPVGPYKLVTNSAGVVEGSFIIPKNDALKFATGTREFRLSDSSTNDRNTEITFAEASYHAQGLLEVTEERIFSTKVPKLVQSEVREDRTLVETTVSETTEYIDPVAETFLVDKAGGIFVKSVDLFFRRKDPSIPVRVTIRTTLNGFPTQRIVPGADKILYPGSVNLPTDSNANNGFGNADVATNFEFDYPVYLSQDTEYAIVITSQCDNYEVYVADMGGLDLTDSSQRITKQPYNGVFFSSANASTWTPEQSKDLKFKLNRASFSGSSAEITLVNDSLPKRKLVANPFYFTSGTTNVIVSHRNHGMYNTSAEVTISGVSGTHQGITAATLNGTHTITAFTHDTYTIDVGGSNASGTGYAGGTGVKATENRHVDVMWPSIQNMAVPGTSIQFFATIYSGKSVDGTETPYQASSEFEVLANRNYRFITPKLIGSAIEEAQNMSSNKSFQLRCVLSTTDEALSPIIDMNRASVNTVQNIITSNNGSETDASGGSEFARYITKKVELNEQADVATVFLNAIRSGAGDIDLYYRVTQNDEDITAVDWTEATPVNSIPVNPVEFQEVRYDIDPLGAGVSFSAIQFKIVLKSTISSLPPLIKDFRAICAT